MADLSQKEKWRIYEASQHYIDQCNQRQRDQDAKSDKWILTLAAGSFGLSFAFIDKIVPLSSSSYRELLIAAWACFAAVLILELAGFAVSSFIHSSMANAERKNILLKYQGETPENKDRTIFFNGVAVCGHISMLSFAGGVVCLLLFIAKNFIVQIN
ncbi:MAG: hypothetical protein LBH35_07910 [Treponema sp.]|nr:hypothetical protein [Treponema sp.]